MMAEKSRRNHLSAWVLGRAGDVVDDGSDDIPVSVDAMARAAGFVELPPGAGVVVENSAGEIVAASEQAQTILGLSFEQMRGSTLQDPRWASVDESGQFVEAEQHPAMIARRTRSAVRGHVFGVHRPGADAAGRYVWLHVDAVPIVRDSDTAPWVVAALRPVTGEQLQALELGDSERLHRMIAEYSSDMVAWQLVPETTYLWVSSASRKVLGFDPDALIGTHGIDRVHPDDLGPHLAESWQAARGTPPTFTLRMRHADGSYRWIETTSHLLPSAGGRPQQMITAHRDVSDRVAAEHARDTAVRLFETAMTHATIGIAWCRLNGTLARVNPALCTILGRSADELIGCSLTEFATDDGGAFEDAVTAVQAGTLSYHESERQFCRPDATVAWCLTTVIGLPDQSGVIRNILVQLQDITDQKKAAAQLEQAALTDPLTGLPNRTVLEDRLSRALNQARRTGTAVGVLFIDLDQFKRINDSHGHEIGDHLLCEVGIRLSAAVRHTDVIVRLGGDEFVVVREQISDPRQLDDLAEQIADALAKPFVINTHTLTISASIGGAAGANLTANQLLSQADNAMYQAKRDGRNYARNQATQSE
jgi:diguanylate cyclase (GGDEF)-like protein/PAS domain S-box-containing protein